MSIAATTGAGHDVGQVWARGIVTREYPLPAPRPGPRFDAVLIRDELARGLSHAIKTKKIELVDTVPLSEPTSRRGKTKRG